MRKLINNFKKMDKGDKAIVVEVGLAVIAVVLLVLFQSEMKEFISTLVDSMQTQVSNMLTAGVGAGGGGN